jgi:hypothetical protein
MIVLNAQQLQRLAEALLRLQRLLEAEGGDASGVEEGLEEVAARLRVHLEMVRLADRGTLMEVLAPGGDPDHGRLWAVGELLFLDGLRAAAEAKVGEALDRLEKAELLLGSVDPAVRLPERATEPRARLREIEALLGAL